MAHKLKVRIHKWDGGILRVEDHYFFNHNKAMEFAKKSNGDCIKIYNLNGVLVHEINNLVHETYA